jgi:hypothetical protein
MKLLRRAALNGVQLDEIDKRILIQKVEPASGKDQVNAISLWGAAGNRVNKEHRDYLDVVVSFSMDIKRNALEERSEIFEKVMGWAMGGGWLTLSQKPDRRLRVIAAQLPAEGDPLEWTNRYSITFRAYGVPYWEKENASQLRIGGTSGTSRQFGVPGNVRGVMDAQFTNTSGGTINTFSISCSGGGSISLSGLGLGNGETLVIDHPNNGRQSWLRIRIGGRSVMGCRTSGSSNDLYCGPGTTTVSMSAGGSGTLLLSCNGRFA